MKTIKKHKQRLKLSMIALLAPLLSLLPLHGHADIAQIGKAKAAEIAKKRYGGKVLKIEEVKSNGKTVYRVRLIKDDGRVKTVTVTGQGDLS